MIAIRPAKQGDLEALGKLSAALVRLHHTLDPQRFFLIEPIEDGYGRWLSREMKREGAVVLVAEKDGEVVGYTYGTIEERDWNALRDECGALHDVIVAEPARGQGIATKLVEAMCAKLHEMGAPRVVLSTAAKNEPAQKMFERLGFRRTMIEYTRETK